MKPTTTIHITNVIHLQIKYGRLTLIVIAMYDVTCFKLLYILVYISANKIIP